MEMTPMETCARALCEQCGCDPDKIICGNPLWLLYIEKIVNFMRLVETCSASSIDERLFRYSRP